MNVCNAAATKLPLQHAPLPAQPPAHRDKGRHLGLSRSQQLQPESPPPAPHSRPLIRAVPRARPSWREATACEHNHGHGRGGLRGDTRIQRSSRACATLRRGSRKKAVQRGNVPRMVGPVRSPQRCTCTDERWFNCLTTPAPRNALELPEAEGGAPPSPSPSPSPPTQRSAHHRLHSRRRLSIPSPPRHTNAKSVG